MNTQTHVILCLAFEYMCSCLVFYPAKNLQGFNDGIQLDIGAYLKLNCASSFTNSL